MDERLPPDVTDGASLRGNEYAWTISSFPKALVNAKCHGYACLGGQFQFRLPDGSTCEMYWLDSDSGERRNDESWMQYSDRSCTEVLENFKRRIEMTDFAQEAKEWRTIIDPNRDLVFVAYFVSEAELTEIAAQELI